MPRPMNPWLLAVLSCLLLAPGTFAGSTDGRLAHARYVALGFDVGDRFVGENEVTINGLEDVLPADRRALAAVREQLEKWGRYSITIRPGQAELLIAVRTGRRASLGTTIQGGGSNRGGALRGGGYRAELSSPDDMLSVYEGGSRSPSVPLWRRTREGGLSDPSLKLFEDLRSDVERATKKP